MNNWKVIRQKDENGIYYYEIHDEDHFVIARQIANKTVAELMAYSPLIFLAIEEVIGNWNEFTNDIALPIKVKKRMQKIQNFITEIRGS